MDADQGGGVRTYHCHIRGQATRGGCGAGYVRKRRKRVRCIGRVQGARGSAGGGGYHIRYTHRTRVFSSPSPLTPPSSVLSLSLSFSPSLFPSTPISPPVFFPSSSLRPLPPTSPTRKARRRKLRPYMQWVACRTTSAPSSTGERRNPVCLCVICVCKVPSALRHR